jgi:hypothetical protein
MRPGGIAMNVFALRAAFLLAAGTLAATAVTSADPLSLGEKAKLDGIITARSGDTMTVKTDQGLVVAVLTENTSVSARKGKIGLIRKDAAATALIPGLKVSVEGVGDQGGRLIATKVRFLSGDLETARAIQAGSPRHRSRWRPISRASRRTGRASRRTAPPSTRSRASRPTSPGASASSANTT